MKSLIFSFLFMIVLPLGLMAQDETAAAARDYTNAVLWQQHSGEYRALSFQAYNFARLSLLEQLKQADRGKLNCVVVDIDETVLDNSPFQGTEIKKGISYQAKDWFEWTSKGAADTVPGALAFLKYAAMQGVETFYITNRELKEHNGTLANLQHFGFPYSDEAHLILKSSTSDKEPRRQQVLQKYNILLLCGDNLSDFSNVFYREGKNTREQVDLAQQLFGTKYIVLPNPMYGDWEKQFYKGEGLKEADRSKQRLESLKTY
ncbi:5'-nucleotidase, lipoprotein e(P4) family [Pedobacter sp. MC2016-24]|uniref:5'-nucleotidase, lipoprotein e(P4) family n=1 Tax=Pedobacter sp. MC2016-24 TaxID=2780090 RepID=UPI001881F247|nr:5'-nucleotidase, lipoprotein e(P4) family [Pedobacter sp. MC2016-24]MBE9599026.1 5'-nucleotidase, lipoprotein e(P4) family [Pedobacter sp. MC2016-24]